MEVTASVRQHGTGLVFVGKKGRLAVDVETSGGEWEWDVRTMDNGRGELPVAKDAPEGKWAIWVAGKTQNTPPDGRPRRIAVKFKKPVTSAMVEFHFRAVGTNIPEPENVPELMRAFAGEEVKTKEAWEKVRAPELLELGLSVPQITQIFLRLKEMGLDIDTDIYTMPYAVKTIRRALAAKQGKGAL